MKRALVILLATFHPLSSEAQTSVPPKPDQQVSICISTKDKPCPTQPPATTTDARVLLEEFEAGSSGTGIRSKPSEMLMQKGIIVEDKMTSGAMGTLRSE